MFINGKSLLLYAPIKDMETEKKRLHGVSYGLAEAGYDIRIKQDITYVNDEFGKHIVVHDPESGEKKTFEGNFCLAQAMEEFQMPDSLVGQVKDKSTWARKGLSVFNTVAEPGWNGFLTMELVFHGESVHIKAGSGIAQVLFAMLIESGDYGDGKYQNAKDLTQGQEAITS